MFPTGEVMISFSIKSFDYPFRRAVAYSLVGHVCAAVLLFLLGVLPMPPRKMPRHEVRPIQVRVEVMTEKPKEPDKKQGEDREIEVSNAKPVAKPPKPLPTPVPPPKPTAPPEKVVYEPLPTPKSLVKKAESKKKVLPTPEPTAKPTAKPTAAPTKAPKRAATPKKKVVATPAPRAPTPAPTKPPAPAPKGDPEGAPPQASGVMQTEEGVDLPPDYLLDARRRFQDNFLVPLHVARQLDRQGKRLQCIVAFKIARDGRIFDVEVRQSSGRDQLDVYAVRALKNVATLLPLVDYTKKPHISASVAFQFGEGE